MKLLFKWGFSLASSKEKRLESSESRPAQLPQRKRRGWSGRWSVHSWGCEKSAYYCASGGWCLVNSNPNMNLRNQLIWTLCGCHGNDFLNSLDDRSIVLMATWPLSDPIILPPPPPPPPLPRLSESWYLCVVAPILSARHGSAAWHDSFAVLMHVGGVDYICVAQSRASQSTRCAREESVEEKKRGGGGGGQKIPFAYNSLLCQRFSAAEPRWVWVSGAEKVDNK